MKIRVPKALLAAAAGVVGVLGAGANHAADAFFFFPVPFETPIAECGTVVTVPSWYDTGDNDCVAWLADSGGAYLVDGIESMPIGTRVFVDGMICNFCHTTCQAGAILDSTLSACSGGGGGDS